ncbi:bacteriocin immunity protein [Companilactobacillus farciminis]|uniref:bacteriocin immunity protein n=1 Tax=Companilactobacillus farciminis TaxID=1612 RepID=UPI00241D0BE1|nr:bacteriocin immunity protein [Companilactobacillus farciminis]
MNVLKWFSGGRDRANNAIEIIADLLIELNGNIQTESLQQVLIKYKDELERQESSVPYILSRMNIDISSAMSKDGIILSKKQSILMKQLRSLSNIYYGY